MFNINDIMAVTPEMLIAAGACLVLLVDLVTGKDKKCFVAALSLLLVIGAAIGSYCLLTSELNGITAFKGTFGLDNYAAFIKFILYISAAAAILLSVEYIKKEDINMGEYYVLLLFSLSGMMVMASGKDLLTIYLGVEMMSIPIYALVGFAQSDRRSNEGAMKYVILGAFSSGIMLFGISLIYGLTGTTELGAVSEAVALTTTQVPALTLAVVMLVVGFSFKVAGVPFHMWAPDAYEGAPTPITAFMSVGAKAAAFAVIIRVFIEGLYPLYDKWYLLLALVSVASMIYGNFVAIAQKNIKRMLAYSSIGHAGYALLGLVVGTDEGTASVIFYMAVYALMNIGAFAVIILMRLSGRNGENIEDYTGLAKTNKFTALVMMIFLFSLAGIPPTAGFIGKFYVFMALINKGYLWLAVIAVIMSAVAAYFYIRIIMLMYMKEPVEDFKLVCSKALIVVIAIATAGVLYLGVFPQCVIDLAKAASRLL